jgi:hypothetical protein
MTTHLIIPDSHSHPDFNNDRYDWLGQLIADVKPDVVINIGDHWDLSSLSTYDVGTKAHEGKRYLADLEHGSEAMERYHNPIRRLKKGQPRWVFCIGNHEHRITKAVEKDPKLEGVLSLNDLDLDYFRYETFPFLDKVEIDGIYYSHYFSSGIMGRAISGERPAYTLLTKQFVSCTQGHSHLLDFCRRVDPIGRPILGLNVGCFFDYDSPWAGPANKFYYRGVVICRNVSNGNYDLELVSMETLKASYARR